MIIKNDDYRQQPILIKSVFMKSHLPPTAQKKRLLIKTTFARFCKRRFEFCVLRFTALPKFVA